METMTPQEVHNKMQEGTIYLIDVREPGEYETIRIPGSHLIPLGSFSSSAIPPHCSTVIIHCRSGARSAKACEIINTENSSLKTYNMTGGILAWEAAGLPVQRGTRNVLPVDRQTQIGIGIITFSSFLLGHFYNPNFHMLSGLMGAGLIFAGATGFCGLARILARAPWNQ